MVFEPKFKSLGFKHLVYRLFNGHCIRIQLQLTFFFHQQNCFFMYLWIFLNWLKLDENNFNVVTCIMHKFSTCMYICIRIYSKLNHNFFLKTSII